MPGMAEPDIAIDIVSSASSLSASHATHSDLLAPRPRLARRTLGLIGLDATVTAATAFSCYALFNPARQLTTSSVVVPLAAMTVCLVLSFFERGLYAPQEVVSRELPWRKIAGAWLQAVAIGTLSAFCLAAITGHSNLTSEFDNVAGTLSGVWLPAFVLLGFGSLIAARSVRLRFHAGPAPLNRTVIIGEQGSIHDLLLQIRYWPAAKF